jgi:N-acetylglucosaminylphosphatidylinositol deacetylase
MINELFQQIVEMNIFRYFFSLLIISNFILIISLHFKLEIEKKTKLMFNISDTKKELNKIKSILLIIAHPDDEILFWTPTIKKLKSLNLKLKILCLSNGNSKNKGKKRTEEFKKVSKYLKLEDNEILNVPELQDSMKKFWDEKIVSEKISNFLNENKDIETILTFDEIGITNHPNHISCYNGLVYYLKNHRDDIKNKGINIYLLDSFKPLYQYTHLIPFIVFYFREFGFFSYHFFTSYKIMKIYKSQFNWKRKLYVIFSAYSYYNSYIKVELE